MVWKAKPNNSAWGNYGGWRANYINIDHTKSYRVSVWLKKRNSHDGSIYFGLFGSNSTGSYNTLNLDGNNDPYFWSGDLPQLNRWYLLVGYVHSSSHAITTFQGRIYDGVTGEAVQTIKDLKFENGATYTSHVAFIQDNNYSDELYLYAPRIDKINGEEPSIDKLLKINNDSKITLSYDAAGNQTQNFYCRDSHCTPSAYPRKILKIMNPISSTTEEDITEEDSTDITEENTTKETREEALGKSISDNYVRVYPNPTNGLVTLRLDKILLKNIQSIGLYNVNSVLIKDIHPKGTSTSLDLSNIAVGIYFIHVHINGGKSITKRIIKK